MRRTIMSIVNEILAVNIDLDRTQVFAIKVDALSDDYELGTPSRDTIIRLAAPANKVPDRERWLAQW
jgi:hypothetical protein